MCARTLCSVASVAALSLLAACDQPIQPTVPPDLPAVSTPQFSLVDLTPGVESPVSTYPSTKRAPRIDGDYVVWSDERFQQFDPFMFDLSSGTETKLPSVSRTYTFADVSGSRVVWPEARDGNWDIYMYDIDTGTTTRVTSGPALEINPAIDGDNLVWEEYSSWENSNIFHHDLSTGITTQVTNEPAVQRHPDVSGTKVVWEDYRSGQIQVWVYDVATGVEREIGDLWGQGWAGTSQPVISGDRVVWRDEACSCLYLYELTRPRAFKIYPSQYQGYSAIDGPYVVWQSAGEVWLADYSAGLYNWTVRRISSDEASAVSVAISGDRVVWLDKRNGHHEVYLYVIPPDNEPPVANAGEDQAVVRTSPAGAAVTLDGSGSHDPDGDIAGYEWFLAGVKIAEGIRPTLTLPLGSNDISLLVTDDDGATGSDPVSVTVLNALPVADAGADQKVLVTLPVTFVASASDVDGWIDSYRWDMGDGTVIEGPVATHAYAEADRSFDVVLTVTDNDGGEVVAPTVLAIVLTPSQAVEKMISDIDDLEAAGVLDTTQANGLRGPLSDAKRSLDRGNDMAAYRKLGDFIDQLNGKGRGPNVDESIKGPLIQDAEDIRSVIGP